MSIFELFNTPIAAIVVGIFMLLAGFIGWQLLRYQIYTILKQESKTLNDQTIYMNKRSVRKTLTILLRQREQEVNKLKLLETHRQQYTGNIAHELKTPIHTIQGYLDTVIDDPDMDAETMIRFLKKASDNVERLAQIVADLDLITKYESQTLRLNTTSFDLFELINDVLETLDFRAKENGIKLYVKGINAKQFIVKADKDRIMQVLINLGVNSIKYGSKNGSTTFLVSDVGNAARIAVKDDGLGIDSTQLDRIFERFYRVESSRSRDKGGSGLGLSICKHIIEAHGQKIEVISTKGAGSIFSFNLPLE